MNRLINILLGIDTARIPEGAAGGRLAAGVSLRAQRRVGAAADPGGGRGGGRAVVAVSARCAPSAARRRGWGLMAMRVIAAATVVLHARRAGAGVYQRRTSGRVTCWCLLDVSQSMGLRDAWNDDEAKASRVASAVGLDDRRQQVRQATRLELADRVLRRRAARTPQGQRAGSGPSASSPSPTICKTRRRLPHC